MNRPTAGNFNRFSLVKFALVGILSWTHLVSAKMTIPDLPEPVSNNAVASITLKGKTTLYSFMGLAKHKTYKDVHNKVWKWQVGDAQWTETRPVPSELPLVGRLASTAVAVGDHIFIFGGYTVDKDHNEISAPDSYRYLPDLDQYERIADMPVSVDDVATVVYQDRYIYLISGWHNHGNVNLVQVYDTEANTWTQASPLPSAAVFGHSAAMYKDIMVVCDGVTVVPHLGEKRSFAAVAECLQGQIDKDSPHTIHWQKIPHYSGTARYRMAAASDDKTQQLLFAGGSSNPYNYNGIGYNSEPSQPDNKLQRWDISSQTWLSAIPLYRETMDHRGLVEVNGQHYVIGGMLRDQQTTNKVTKIEPLITN